MHSFLIASKKKKTSSDYVTAFLEKEKIDLLDKDMNSYEKAMGIEDVRNIQKRILLKPFKGKTKAVVIEAYESITTEAQNALLKVLEEPPANTIIIISVPRKEIILPTIISRCKVVELNDDKQTLSNDEITQLHNYLISLSQSGIGERLRIAQDLSKNKDDVLLWLEKMTVYLRQRLIKNYNDSQYYGLLKSFQTTYKTIKNTNVNQRIALEDLFLSFIP